MRVPTARIRELRRQQTEAERQAWQLLRGRRMLGLKFHRQYPVGNYVVDFYCFNLRLAVELDGSAHSQPSQRQRDEEKERYLRRLGIGVPNALVLQGPEAFRAKIRQRQLRGG